MKKECSHYNAPSHLAPRAESCEECGSTSSLRVCITCGHVGCCESQQGHDTKHAKELSHPIIKSMPLNEHSWTWCYECNDYIDGLA